MEGGRLLTERAAGQSGLASVTSGSSPEQRLALAQERGAVNQSVHFVAPGTWPLTDSGKIRKRALAERAAVA